MRPIDLSNVQESTGQGGGTLPPGGYVVRIGFASDIPAKQYIKIEYDIAEGEYKDYYTKRQEAHPDWAWGGTFYRSYKDSALGMLKHFCSCVTKSNPNYIFDCNTNADEKTLANKLVGLVLAEEEYVGNDGTIRTRLYNAGERTVEEIRTGKFKVPEKKKAKGAATTPAYSAPYSAPNDADLPFS